MCEDSTVFPNEMYMLTCTAFVIGFNFGKVEDGECCLFVFFFKSEILKHIYGVFHVTDILRDI